MPSKPDADWSAEIARIHARRAAAQAHGGAEAVARHHQKGRLTVRERIAQLVDPGTFEEIGAGAGAALLDEAGAETGFQPANYALGFGLVGGRRIAVGGEDFTLRGGSPNPAGLRKSVYAEDLALTYKVPLVRLHEGGGGAVKGTGPGQPVGDPVFATPRFASICAALGQVPVATAALGAVAGMPAARLVASHFSVMTRDSQVLIAGPAVVERALGQKTTKEELGGATIHTRNGTVDNLAEDEAGALAQIRQFLSYMPANVHELPPRAETADDPQRTDDWLAEAVPRDRRKAFDMRRILKAVLDTGSFFEIGSKFGPGQITGLARLDGVPVGVLANDCRFYAGAMSADGAQKLRKFVDTCNTFHLPILSFVDEPGFMIGAASEAASTIRHGAAAIAAVMQSRVPWACVIVRKVFGVAGAAHFGPDAFILSWPSAETGTLPIEGGVAVAFRREIEAAADPDAKRKELEDKLAALQSPFPRADGFSVHELIDPRETRPRLARWLDWVLPALGHTLGPHLTTMKP